MKLPKIDKTKIRGGVDCGFYVARRNFIGYKKVAGNCVTGNRVIRVLITKGTKVYVTDGKCRARSVIPLDNGVSFMFHWPLFYSAPPTFAYIKGVRARARTDQGYDQGYTRGLGFDYPGPCAPGIHFFIDEKDAKNYF